MQACFQQQAEAVVLRQQHDFLRERGDRSIEVVLLNVSSADDMAGIGTIFKAPRPPALATRRIICSTASGLPKKKKRLSGPFRVRWFTWPGNQNDLDGWPAGRGTAMSQLSPSMIQGIDIGK